MISAQKGVGFLHYGFLFGGLIHRVGRMQDVNEFVYDRGLLIEPRHLDRKIVVFLAQDPNEGSFCREIPLDITHGGASERVVANHFQCDVPLA